MERFLIGALTATLSLSLPVSPLSAATHPSPTATANDANPALWVVRDPDTTLYLFGTFHIMDGQNHWFDNEVKGAFDDSQQLVLEVDLPTDLAGAEAKVQPLVERFAVDPQGHALSTRLSGELNRVLREALATIELSPTEYDRFKPWYINMMLTRALGRRMGASFESGVESVLRRAAGARMSFTALETIEDQFRMFDSLPEEGQLAQLRMMLEHWDAIGNQLPRMLNVWKRGDVEGLDTILNAGFRNDPSLRRTLLENRNRLWADWIVERLDSPGTVFMAVGAGHLTGAVSIQAILSERGIPTARIP